MSTVLIRDAKLSDAPRLLEIYSYYVKNTAITFEYNVPSLEEFRHRMKNITLRYPYIVLEADGKVMGYLRGLIHRPRRLRLVMRNDRLP